MAKKKIFTIHLLIRVVLTILIVYGASMGYRYMHKSFNQNASSVNEGVNQILPKLEKENASLKIQKRNAYNDKLVVDYHYKQAFNAKKSKDKTLKKWIKKDNQAEDKLSNLDDKLSANQKQVNHLKQKYFNKTELKNSQSNLTIIILLITIIVLFFVWSI